MAHQIGIRNVNEADTLYVVLRSRTNRTKVVLFATGALVTETAANRALYAVPLAVEAAGTYYYSGTFPDDTPAGWYIVEPFLQAGVDPAATDHARSPYEAYWTGTTVATPAAGAPVVGSGFLERAIEWVRQATDEPETNAKYSDDEIIELLEDAYKHVLGEVNRSSIWPLTADFDVTIVDSDEKKMYPLPAGLGKVLRISLLNDAGDAELYNIQARGRLHPYGPGFRIEGRHLRVQENVFNDDDIIRIQYAPNGTAHLHEATDTGDNLFDFTGDYPVVTLSAGVTRGTLDLRKSAYIGCIFRILGTDENGGESTNIVQERIITAHDALTRKITLGAGLDVNPEDTDNVTYEIGPVLEDSVDRVVAIYTALDIAGTEGNTARERSLERRYLARIRDIRMMAYDTETYNTRGMRRNLRGRYNGLKVPRM